MTSTNSRNTQLTESARRLKDTAEKKQAPQPIKRRRRRIAVAAALIVVVLGWVVAALFAISTNNDEPPPQAAVPVRMQTQPVFIERVLDKSTGECVGADSVAIPGSTGGTYMYGNTSIAAEWWPDNNGVTVKLEGGARRIVSGFIVSGDKVGTVGLADSTAQKFTLNRADFGGSVPEGKTVMCITTDEPNRN